MPNYSRFDLFLFCGWKNKELQPNWQRHQVAPLRNGITDRGQHLAGVDVQLLLLAEVARLTPLSVFSLRPTALIAIGQYSSTIETVDAGWCKDITDQGATQIAQSSKSLRYLGLMRCDKVIKAGQAAACAVRDSSPCVTCDFAFLVTR